MSELKRNTNNFSFGAGEKPAEATTPGIEESQPRQTLEMKRAMALWEGSQEVGSDPYNAVGARAIRPRAA
jgi:hypothetical protein